MHIASTAKFPLGRKNWQGLKSGALPEQIFMRAMAGATKQAQACQNLRELLYLQTTMKQWQKGHLQEESR